jgi:hypothetical protein
VLIVFCEKKCVRACERARVRAGTCGYGCVGVYGCVCVWGGGLQMSASTTVALPTRTDTCCTMLSLNIVQLQH